MEKIFQLKATEYLRVCGLALDALYDARRTEIYWRSDNMMSINYRKKIDAAIEAVEGCLR